VIAERGGASAGRLYRVLCQEGPFKRVDIPTFTDVLRALGQPDTGLIEQSDDGLLLLGRVGEKLVEHYSFYAVFQTPEEYRLISGGKELGTLPIVNVMAPGMMLIFSGRRWVIQEIDDQDKVIMVVPSKGGTPPIFGGDPGDIHDRVIERMFTVLESEDKHLYADKAARDLLDEARREYSLLGLATASIIPLGETSVSVATRVGTVKTTTLALALRAKGFEVDVHDGFLTVSSKDGAVDVRATMHGIASGEPANLFGDQTNLIFEKFHTYLSRDLLERDALACKLDLGSLPKLCQKIIGH
jgi:ATP-dependent Lhr-like helicase